MDLNDAQQDYLLRISKNGYTVGPAPDYTGKMFTISASDWQAVRPLFDCVPYDSTAVRFRVPDGRILRADQMPYKITHKYTLNAMGMIAVEAIRRLQQKGVSKHEW